MMHVDPQLPDGRKVRAELERLLLSNGAAWLAARRWYGDKGRMIAGLTIEDLIAQRVGEHLLVLAVIRLRFDDGAEARYFLPLTPSNGAAGAVPIGAIELAGSASLLVDATETTWFGRWLLDQLGGRRVVPGSPLQFTSEAGAMPILEDARRSPATLMGAEQSNTSLRFDDALILKLFRRLQPGPSPDQEALQALTALRFSHVPAFVGSASWRVADGETYPIALGLAFVPNQGDGWSWTLGRLRKRATVSDEGDGFAAERRLGRRTAELHLAMSQVPGADFQPEPASEAQVRAEVARVQAAAEAAVALLLEREHELPAAVRSQLSSVVGNLQQATRRAGGFLLERGLPRIRVHGDYHLGQTLRTVDGDWVIIDFEGEPARPVAERRQKTSPLKDVAGMLRSFTYARGVAQRSMPAAGNSDWLDRWEEGARTTFTVSYRETMRESGAKLVPGDDDAFYGVLDAWELDKAVYEIAYEAQNRPDWIDIPLRFLMTGA